MTEIRLIRHGEIPLNSNRGVIAGRSVTQSLNKLGREQARQLGEVYQATGVHPDAAYRSDTLRNQETGQLVLSVCAPWLSMEIADGLHEISLGSYEGLAREQVYTPEVVEQIQKELFDFKLPGTESMRDVATRAREAVLSIGSRHPNQVVFAFTHYLTISCLVGFELGWSHANIRTANIPNCSETKIFTDSTTLNIEHIGRLIGAS